LNTNFFPKKLARRLMISRERIMDCHDFVKSVLEIGGAEYPIS
jgi:hypothetical protein